MHRDAILFGYQEMDRLLGEMMALEPYGVTLVLSTALSQRANADAGKRYYRPRDVGALMQSLGLHPLQLLPVMAHQVLGPLQKRRPMRKAARERPWRRSQLDGQAQCSTLPTRRRIQLFFNCGIGAEVPATSQVAARRRAANDGPLLRRDLLQDPAYEDRHPPPGRALWFKTGAGTAVHADRTSILNIFPTLLDYFGVPVVPADGLPPRTGHSILDQIGMDRFATRPLMAAE